MTEILTMLLTSAASGGATGLLGVLIQRWFDHKGKSLELEKIRLQNDNNIALAQIESERAKARAQADLEVAQEATYQEEVRAEVQSLVAAYGHDKAQYLDAAAQRKSRTAAILMAVVDFSRGMVRPVMTLYLLVLVTWMFAWAIRITAQHGQGFSPEQVHQLVTQVTATILYMFTAIGLFWFGTRPKGGG